MSVSKLDSKLFSPLFSDPEVGEEFSDEQFISYLLEFEAVLARVQAEQGIIPPDAGEAIAQRASTLKVDIERLQTQTERDGFPIIELVRQLRERVGGEAATYVHWGATTQDVMDTALVLQIRSVLNRLENRLQLLITNLARLADKHRDTLMAGRTHSQQALPIPFGLKVAGWLAPLLRHRQRLAELKPRVLVVQFGGAAGTLAAELNLAAPLMPWHTQRDNLAELAC